MEGRGGGGPGPRGPMQAARPPAKAVLATSTPARQEGPGAGKKAWKVGAGPPPGGSSRQKCFGLLSPLVLAPVAQTRESSCLVLWACRLPWPAAHLSGWLLWPTAQVELPNISVGDEEFGGCRSIEHTYTKMDQIGEGTYGQVGTQSRAHHTTAQLRHRLMY